MLTLSTAPADLSSERMRTLFAYQPFCLPDGTVTGSAAAQLGETTARWMNEREAAPEQFARFRELNDNLARNYEDIIAGVKAVVGPFDGLTFGDVGSNAGYFCYRMLQEGCAAATGIDAGDFAAAYAAANEALDLNVRFIRRPYNMMTHRIDGLDETFDIVSCIAFLCHSSDPTYLLAHLASLTRRAFVIYTMVPASKDLFIRYHQTTGKYFNETFPICFDAATAISEPLFRTGLTKLGFTRIIEVPRQPYWVLRESDSWRCFVALR
jgi:hypothetical protein